MIQQWVQVKSVRLLDQYARRRFQWQLDCNLLEGAKWINDASVKGKDDLVVEAGMKVHKSCRQQYINVKNIKSHFAKKSSASVPGKRTTRCWSGAFDSAKDCIFCGCTVDLNKGHFSWACTDKFVETILEVCESRLDDWGLTVKGHI